MTPNQRDRTQVCHIQFPRWVKLVAVGVAAIFTWDTVVWSQPNFIAAVGTGEISIRSLISEIDIPESIGRVEERYLPSAISDTTVRTIPLIIHIQDAHAHPEVQRNIQALLAHLAGAKKIDKVAVEGAFGKVDTHRFDFFRVPEANHAAAEYLLELGELTGAEFYGVTENRARIGIEGVDDRGLYLESFKLFQKVKSQEETIERFIFDYGRKLEQLEAETFNPDLVELVIRRREWDRDQADLPRYFIVLNRLSKEYLEIDLTDPRHQFDWPNLTRMMKTQEVESKVDLSQAASERDRLSEILETKLPRGNARRFLIEGLNVLFEDRSFHSWVAANRNFPEVKTLRHFVEVLYRETKDREIVLVDYPELIQFLGLLILREEIDTSKLFEEIDRLEAALERKLVKSKAEKQLLQISKDFQLIEKLLSLKLTRQDFELYEERKKQSVHRLGRHPERSH